MSKEVRLAGGREVRLVAFKRVGRSIRLASYLAVLFLTLTLVAGCAVVDPAYLEQAKERYQRSHGLLTQPQPAAPTARPAAEEPAAAQGSSHAPYASRDCGGCHNLQEGLRLWAQGAELCWRCHQKADFEGEYLHGPVAVGDCVFCHDPHKSEYEDLLTAKGGGLCLECHRRQDLGELHSGVGEECLSCHDPHRGSVPALLR